mmetsp:Transcript_20267/g.56200  ORF Transcript_20267/g.56200 Transcript_20267/m.56200 type:complete len:291 (+) Transcript_20267:549-1421(+)
MGAGEEAGETERKHIVGGEPLDDLGVLHHAELREDRHRLQVYTQCPQHPVEDEVVCAGLGYKGEDHTGPNHVEDVYGVEVCLVGCFEREPHNVYGIERGCEREEIQQSVDVVLHHETAVQADGKEEGGELLGAEGEAGAVLPSLELVDEDGDAQEVDDLGHDEEVVMVLDHEPEEEQQRYSRGSSESGLLLGVTLLDPSYARKDRVLHGLQKLILTPHPSDCPLHWPSNCWERGGRGLCPAVASPRGQRGMDGTGWSLDGTTSDLAGSPAPVADSRNRTTMKGKRTGAYE